MFRLWQTSVVGIYAPVYMKIYGSQYETYTTIDSMSVFIAGISTNILSAIIMEKF